MDTTFGVTPYHAKFFAHALTREGGRGVARLQQSLLNASVDLNPHQVEAALFALHSPISKGVLLADEVGLGKTIEAGLVMCQLWAERKRKILVVCPASLRKQWQCELEDKFNLPCEVVDAKSARQIQKAGFSNPYAKPAILISSYSFAAKNAENLREVQWDLVVMDEAHKLRNSYRESSKVGQALRWAFEDRRKLLLTATPLQNSLTELYGLATLLDDTFFGDLPSFRSRYVNGGGDLDSLRKRLKEFTWRTLRKDVLPFVKYTNRLPLTESFACSDLENALYEDVSKYLQDETTYAFPQSQRSMLTLIVRKVLASSTWALVGTLEHILARLLNLQKDSEVTDDQLLSDIFRDDPDLADEIEEDAEDEENAEVVPSEDAPTPVRVIDHERLKNEIDLVRNFISRARSIGTDTKTRHLLTALKTGWDKLKELGAAEKAVVFTESRRSMNFLREYLEANGYAGDVVCFSGGGKKDEASNRIYEDYKASHPEDESSKGVMMRHALIDAFKNKAKILIATEAGAEGINLQFCSMIVNYDLPWNPQRVEQRIGRCHRYGQKFDVVVINFCNTRNAADMRVYELLAQKFRLFEGLFGASNDVLGVVDKDGKSFERQIHDILQKCRGEAEITAAFDRLQEELQAEIAAARGKTCREIVENLDEDVRKVLKVDPEVAKDFLDEGESRFMSLTRYVLADRADFPAEDPRTFNLKVAPSENIREGLYSLKANPDDGLMPYRPNCELGEWSVLEAKARETPAAEVTFDVSRYVGKISVVETLKGRSGYLRLDRLELRSLDHEDFLLFTAVGEDGRAIDAKTAERFFRLSAGAVTPLPNVPAVLVDALESNAAQYAKATAMQVGEENNAHFKDASDKVYRWSEDQIAAATHKIEALRARQMEVERGIRHAKTLDEQMPLQKEFDTIRREIRRARANISTIEDETDAKRHRLLDALQRKLVPEVKRETLFTIKWNII